MGRIFLYIILKWVCVIHKKDKPTKIQ
jgi:hypothetical protein